MKNLLGQFDISEDRVRALVADTINGADDGELYLEYSESEALIQTAIETLVKGRTSIVIAHRLSTIRHAHKVMVLDKGELKEFGTSEELLAKNGYYKKLHDMQFMKQQKAAEV